MDEKDSAGELFSDDDYGDDDDHVVVVVWTCVLVLSWPRSQYCTHRRHR